MKRFHQYFLIAMALLLFTASLTVSAFAATEDKNSQILKFEDGSYIVITIEYDQPQNGVSYFANRSTKGGTKKYTYYDGSDTLAWEFPVRTGALVPVLLKPPSASAVTRRERKNRRRASCWLLRFFSVSVMPKILSTLFLAVSSSTIFSFARVCSG